MTTGYKELEETNYLVNVHVSPLFEDSVRYSNTKRAENIDDYVSSIVVAHLAFFDEQIGDDIDDEENVHIYDSVQDGNAFVKTLLRYKELNIYILTKGEKQKFDDAIKKNKDLNLGWIYLTRL